MIKKFYRIILLYDKTQFNKSFSFSKTGLLFNSLLLAIIFFAASFGIFRFIKPHATQEDYINLKSSRLLKNNLLIGETAHSHNGLDIAAKLNSPIYAAQEGLVVFADSLIDLGNTIIISHPNNFITLYSHLNKIKVHMRDYVKSKQMIGTIGESGNSNGPHLHFEIWQNSNIIDPRSLIKEYKENDVSIE